MTARAAPNGIQPRLFFPRQCGRRRAAFRLTTNCLQTACTVSLCKPRSALVGRQLDQIEDTRPTLFLASRRLLDLAAIIPDVVDRARMGTKGLGGGGFLNAVSISEDHTLHLIGPLSHARAAASNMFRLFSDTDQVNGKPRNAVSFVHGSFSLIASFVLAPFRSPSGAPPRASTVIPLLCRTVASWRRIFRCPGALRFRRAATIRFRRR